MIRSWQLFVCVSVVCLLTFVGSALAGPPKNLTEFGPSVSMGDGYVRAFTTVNPSGMPLRIGVEFNGAAFQNLPSTFSDGKWEYDGHTCCGHEHVLQLPQNAAATEFEWAMVNWNPGGHVPPGVWDLPHFDFHFYMMEEAERYNITPGICEAAAPGTLISCDAFQLAMQPLPADEEVPGYINPGAVEAGMGAHLRDPSSPEFNGEIFTRTFLYGAWKGSLNFMEPMITVAELQKKEAEHCTSYPTPEAMPSAGFYPTEYCTRYDAGNDLYYVTLQAFKWFPKSDGILGN